MYFPTNARVQKGRPSSTKRDKTGEEYENDKIKQEMKEENKRKRNEDAEIARKNRKKSKKNSTNTDTTITKKEAELLSKRCSSAVIHTKMSNKQLFEHLPKTFVPMIAALVDPKPDGNCGFRAVSLAVFQQEDAWIQVKKKMLSVFIKNVPLYQTYGVESIAETERILTSIQSPCSSGFWYNAIECPQLTADAYGRSVELFSASPKVDKQGEHMVNNYGETLYAKSAQTFVPLSYLDPNYLFDPIVLYLVELRTNPKTKKHIKFDSWPRINPYHKYAMKKHSNECPIDLSSTFQ